MSRELAIILAAGKGTRMKSDLPKVLVQARGRPLIDYVLDAVQTAGVEKSVVVVGYRADTVRAALNGRRGVEFADQTEQLGTGHAVMACRKQLADHDGPVVIVYGDAPLMQASSIRALVDEYNRQPAACILGTVYAANPFGLGRILRNDKGEFTGIIEERDATDQQRKIPEVCMGYYVFNSRDLLFALENIRANNAQREYYLTDTPGVLVANGQEVRALPVLKPFEAQGVNTAAELAAAEAVLESWESL
jgi:bifunctional UDP-N-acetylglucosamine pyrophosphorylase/glucosamine-1-phosphate N-acetyltransferase/UDP-N-acetylglucosamine pyrophosphorylase